ncbi:WD40/YVTN/BNR-like repeat-containing protein [Paenibacillus graminis]|uniref:WD40/YVTN/BNR-like repeat-containing protein n=1 Tax=Paenibacillus graminis TaxID=189425 RepID=UPI0004B8DBF0|nr:YCF48-related protein [Paenibacillus graminis]MEC0169552.1 YCF48-related protein [Paenibacillus graminis]
MSHKHIGFRVLGAVFTVFLTLLIFSACSSPPPEPSQPPQPTEAPEEGQTITLITPDAKNVNNENTPKYQIQTRLTDFRLLNDAIGLAWGVTKNELRIYMTKDNGETWSNISPSANVQFLSNPVYGKDILFTDPSNGWIIRSASGLTETVVLRTTDGGSSWKVSSFPDANAISSIYFNSPDYGWLMTSWDAKATKESKALYATSDGGATWSLVMQNEQYNPNLPNNTIPVSGVITGMVFKDISHGFVTMQTGALPKIYMTKDGAATWNPGPEFLVNDQFRGCDKVITGEPDFFDKGSLNGWMSVGCQKDKEGSITYNGYFTANGGENWKFVSFGLGTLTGINRHIPPTFLNSRLGWALKQDVLYKTTNQGKTWTALPASSVLKSKLVDYPEIVKLQFISSEVGWLLIEKKEDRKSILLQTTNGGLSWRVM